MFNKVSNDSETIQTGQQVITACAFIYTEIKGQNHVFVAKRAASKKFLPGVFELPGGHIEYGEDPSKGLAREVLEEFNMHITIGNLFGCFTYENQIKQTHSIEVIYFAKFIDPIEQITLNPNDHSEYLWLKEKELDLILNPEKGSADPEFKIIQLGFKILKNPSTILQFN